MKTLLLGCVALLLIGCLGMPDSVQPVNGFQLENYLGKWYEVARLDHQFERGLSKVSAEYQLGEDGSVRVLNQGFSAQDNEWQQAEGKAYFVDDNNQGYLKVSFFGPFYGSYVVFELDKVNYQYAFVSGPNHDYLWLLSRSATVSDEVMQKFIVMSQQRGFDTDKLIYVAH